jgi:ligand-binding sensor domain-containing protein
MHIRTGRSSAAGALVLLALFANGPAFALDPDRTLTQYVHRIWQNQIGLPQATISAIWQSPDGYLWLGTQSGVVRFDGIRFTSLESVYPSAPADIWVRQMVEDAKHTLWIGTNDSGLIHLANDKVQSYSAKNGLPSDNIQCLASSRDGDMWACTADGLVRVRDGAIQIFRTEQGLPVNNIRAVCAASDGTLWVGTDSSWLSTWNGSKFVSHRLASIPADAGVRSMLCSGDGAIWVGTTDGLVRFKDGREQLFSVRDGLADNFVSTLAESRDGSLFAGTRHGFSRLRKGEIESFRPQDGLSQSIVFSLYEDREGSLWVGTKHGLNQFLDGRAVPYTVSEGLPSNDTGPVVQDARGSIWVGTLGAGLARFEGRRFKVPQTRQPLASNTVYALYDDAKSGLWVGTDRGLNRVVDGQVEQTFTTRQGLPSNSVQSLFKDRAGSLWAGTSAGVAELVNGEFVEPPALRSAITIPVLAIGENRQRLFFATERGVYSYANGKVAELTQDGTPLRSADAFYLDPDGLLWIGMLGGGLRMLDGDKISAFPLTDGLFDNDIYGIVRDGEDRLWMACSKGIFSVARSDLRKYAAGDIRRFISNPYSPTDAQRVVESKPGVQPAMSIMRDGRLWFSTTRGLIVLDPNQQRNTTPPPVVIEDVTVNGESKNPGSIGKLEPEQKNLEFHYTGLSFLLPARITFRYILEGYDQKWIDAGTRREAFYTNLPPGNFRFRVVACGIEGNCGEAGTSVAFVVAPYFYQRIWFFPVCAALLALAGWLVYQLRIRGLREQFGLILAERNRIARELHDTLIQGFSGITMEMQALASRLRAPEERTTLEDIIHDAGNCLRETRRSVAGLRSASQGGARSGLSAAIAQAARQITEAKDIRLKLQLEPGPQSLPADVEYNLLRIVQEAVSNSVKHSGARMVEVALNCTPELVRLSVRDDGSGFLKEGNGNGRPGHYGLIGMKERASQIGADLQLASEPGRGTTVSIVLPADRACLQNTR